MNGLRLVGVVAATCRACPDCSAPIAPVFSLASGKHTAWCTCPRKPELRSDGTPRAPGEILTHDELEAMFGTASARTPRKPDRRRKSRAPHRRIDDKRKARLRR